MTKITDLVPSEKILAQRVNVLLQSNNTLINSEIAVDASELNVSIMAGGGRKYGIPFMKPLDASAVNYSTDDDTVGPVGKLEAGEYTALRHDLNWGWKYYALTQMVTQFGIRGGIEAGIADYWNKRLEMIAYNSILGAAASSASLRAGSATAPLDRNMIIDAAATAGEFINDFDVLITNAQNLARLMKDRDNFVQGSTEIGLPRYAGMRVIVSAQVPTNKSIIARAGALAVSSGVVAGSTPIQIVESGDLGNGGGAETLRSRRSFVCHPQGMNYKAAFTAPTLTQLATGSSWELAVGAEHVGIRVLDHTANGADAPAG